MKQVLRSTFEVPFNQSINKSIKKLASYEVRHGYVFYAIINRL